MTNTKFHSAFGCGALTLALFAAPGFAQAHKAEIAGASPMQVLEMVKSAPARDKRMQEVARMREALRLDADGDGMISEDELIDFELRRARRAIEKQVVKRFSELDVDDDGKLSAAEIAIGGPVLMAPVFPPAYVGVIEPPLRKPPPKPECRWKIDRDGCGNRKPGHVDRNMDPTDRDRRKIQLENSK